MEENKRLLSDIKLLTAERSITPEKILCFSKWRKHFREKEEFNNLMKECAKIYINKNADSLPEFLTNK